MTDLPAGLRQALERELGGEITGVRPLGGGDVSAVARLETERGAWCVKWHAAAPPGLFAAEAEGLALLRAAAALPVPAVVAWAEAGAGHPPFLLMEYLAPGPPYPPAALGAGLAALHRLAAPQPGLERDGFIATLAQANAPAGDWAEFWRDRRLEPQVALARRDGRWPAARERAYGRLRERLPALLGHRPPFSLLHGDLWAGNVINAGGRPALIDPAASYGDRETDLAFAALFGGFDPATWAAYAADYPLPPGSAERRPAYQLYWLLVHLNLFGESYGPAVERALRAC